MFNFFKTSCKITKDYLSNMLGLRNLSFMRTFLVSGVTVISITINIGAPFALFYLLPIVSDEPSSLSKTLGIVSAYAVTFGIGQILPAVRRLLLGHITTEYGSDLLQQVIHKYFYLSKDQQISTTRDTEVQFFYETYNEIASGAIRDFSGNIIPTVLEVTSATVVLSYFYKFTGLELAGFLVVYSASGVIGQYIVTLAHKNKQDRIYELYRAILHATNQFQSAHYFSNVEYEVEQFKKVQKNYNRSTNCHNFSRDCNSVIQGILSTGGLTGILLWAAYNVKIHNYSLNDFIRILFYLSQLTASLNEFTGSISSIIIAHSSYRRFLEYVEQKDVREKDDSKIEIVYSDQHPVIEFNNIVFAYPSKDDQETKSKNVLQGVSFKLYANKKYAFVGKSGCGKSTILELLFHFYTAYTGTISVFGQDIRSIKIESLRNSMAVVPQKPDLFNSTIRANIKYGDNKNASEYIIDNAIKEAGLSGICLRHGNNEIGEKGQKLSGGQQKRISIAQAYVKMETKKSPIIIFDEATAGIDSKTEAEILKKFYELAKNKTAIIITHNLTTLQEVDYIYVVEDGQIKEEGDYNALLENKGLFSKMVKLEKNIEQLSESGNSVTKESITPQRKEIEEKFIITHANHFQESKQHESESEKDPLINKTIPKTQSKNVLQCGVL